MDRQPGKLSPDTGQESSSERARKLWSPEEDEKLRLLVSYWGDQRGKNGNWDKISSNFTNRSSKDCRKRWFHSLDPQLKRGKWTEGEDRTLVEAYEQLGPAWQRISQLIPGRTDDQCAKRYTDVLDPKVQNRLREWHADEDNQLIELVKKYGTKWKLISKEMDCRTGLTCRNRWRKLSRDSDEQSSPSTRYMEEKPDIASDRGSVTPMDSMNSMPVQASLPPPPNEVNMLEAGIPGNIPDRRFMPNYPGVSVGTKTYTLSLENPDQYDAAMAGAAGVGSGMHHAINELDLDKILAFAAENGQRIVIHQHVYQMSDYEVPRGAGHPAHQTSAPSAQTAPPNAPSAHNSAHNVTHNATHTHNPPNAHAHAHAHNAHNAHNPAAHGPGSGSGPGPGPGPGPVPADRFKIPGGMGLGGLGHGIGSGPGDLIPGLSQNSLGLQTPIPGSTAPNAPPRYRYQLFDPDADDRMGALPLSRDGTPGMLGGGLPDELGPMSFDLEQHNLNNAELQLDFLAFNPS